MVATMTISSPKGITTQELITLGEIDTSTHPFVAAVREALPNLETMLALESENRMTMQDPAVKQLLNTILWSDTARSPRGFGYLASSLESNAKREALWAALIIKTFRKANCHPLVIPIDEFYRYVPSEPGLVAKTKILTNHRLYDSENKPHVVVLSNFSNSAVFDQATVGDVPTQENAGYKFTGERRPDFTRLAVKLDEFVSISTTGGLSFILDSVEGKLEGVVEYCVDTKEDSFNPRKDDGKLLIASSLLLSDKQMWQDLWYEQSQGVPLYIVAPSTFHDAMNRLNRYWGHGARGMSDYAYRASNSFGNRDEPLFDTVKGDLKIKGEFELSDYDIQGVPEKEFQRRVGYLLERVMAKAEEKP